MAIRARDVAVGVGVDPTAMLAEESARPSTDPNAQMLASDWQDIVTAHGLMRDAAAGSRLVKGPWEMTRNTDGRVQITITSGA